MRLDDLFHLPALDEAFAQLVADGPGLILIAGFDPSPGAVEAGGLRPSGRATIFRVLAEALLQAGAPPTALVAADAGAFRVPRPYRRQVAVLQPAGAETQLFGATTPPGPSTATR